MTVLVDSDILIEVARGRDAALADLWRRTTEREDVLLACSPITVGELWRGARPAETELLTALFNALVCLPIDRAIGRRAGDTMRQFAASHAVEIADSLIGATALLHEAELWTRNRKHYPAKGMRFFGGKERRHEARNFTTA